jgi:hypothetical protein
MFAAGNFMTFAGHVFIEELVIGTSFKDFPPQTVLSPLNRK